jgi:hypothetical protein
MCLEFATPESQEVFVASRYPPIITDDLTTPTVTRGDPVLLLSFSIRTFLIV